MVKISVSSIKINIIVPCTEYNKFITNVCEQQALTFLENKRYMRSMERLGYRLLSIKNSEYDGVNLTIEAIFELEDS